MGTVTVSIWVHASAFRMLVPTSEVVLYFYLWTLGRISTYDWALSPPLLFSYHSESPPCPQSTCSLVLNSSVYSQGPHLSVLCLLGCLFRGLTFWEISGSLGTSISCAGFLCSWSFYEILWSFPSTDQTEKPVSTSDHICDSGTWSALQLITTYLCMH